MIIRPIKKNEIMLLTDFLYEAVFQKDTANLAPRTIIQEPALWVYIDEFGTKKDDCCLVAQLEGIIVGAVWARCVNGFGHVADAVPELAISVYAQYRGRGIGTALLRDMLALLQSRGYSRASLAVQKDNYAVKMYKQAGFEISGESEREYIMICELGGRAD